MVLYRPHSRRLLCYNDEKQFDLLVYEGDVGAVLK